MNEMGERCSRPIRIRTLARAALVLIAIACGKAASPSSSSSSHWLSCETDADCASAGSTARCAEDYCVDAMGARISLPAEPGRDAGDPGDTGDRTGGRDGALECPAPRERTDFICTASTPAWARDPATGACCPYDSRECDAPSGWSAFDSEEECLTSCRCAEVDYGDPPSDFGTERISVECACADENCPADVDDQLARICENDLGVPWVRSEGCGLIRITLEGGFTGGSTVYDAATGALVGLSSFSDIPGGPCNVNTMSAGVAFECDSATRCELCGTDNDDSLPPCE